MQATNKAEKNSKAFLLKTEPYFFQKHFGAALTLWPPGPARPCQPRMILGDGNFSPEKKSWPGEKIWRGKQTIARTPRRTAWGAPGLGIQERMCSVHRDGMKLKSVKCSRGMKCVAWQCCTVQWITTTRNAEQYDLVHCIVYFLSYIYYVVW